MFISFRVLQDFTRHLFVFFLTEKNFSFDKCYFLGYVFDVSANIIFFWWGVGGGGRGVGVWHHLCNSTKSWKMTTKFNFHVPIFSKDTYCYIFCVFDF